jgi:cyclopropane-fatty-acyl-phospholipid synthase
MSVKMYKEKFSALLAEAGVSIHTTESQNTESANSHDIIVNNEGLYARTLTHGSLGLGEAYMDGWWDSPRLDDFFYRVLSQELDKKVRSRHWLIESIKARILNPQKYAAYEIGEHHYDMDDDLFALMLDQRMIYSCGYWKDATTLDEAQAAKLDLIFKKLDLKPGMRVLDIGCGWGGAAIYAAENYGVEVVGITVSKHQAEFATKQAGSLPVRFVLADYREFDDTFDCIYSIGMFEHVGYKNYRTYFEKVAQMLNPGGLFLLHTIGSNIPVTHTDKWIEKYIFPNSMLPSASQISAASEGIFVIEDWHNFGVDYDRTLMEWHRNVVQNKDAIINRFGMSFYRMWEYYLLSCAGSFRARKNQLWQVVLSPKGVVGGYRRP